MGTPFTSSKRTMIKITYNPRSSETKEADFFVTLGGGMKKEKESTQIYLGKQSVEDEISKICSEYEPRNKEECIRSIKREIESPESDVVETFEKKKEESKKKFMQQQQSQQQVQQQQQKVRQTHQQQQQQQQQNQQQYQQHQQQQ